MWVKYTVGALEQTNWLVVLWFECMVIYLLMLSIFITATDMCWMHVNLVVYSSRTTTEMSLKHFLKTQARFFPIHERQSHTSGIHHLMTLFRRKLKSLNIWAEMPSSIITASGSLWSKYQMKNRRTVSAEMSLQPSLLQQNAH